MKALKKKKYLLNIALVGGVLATCTFVSPIMSNSRNVLAAYAEEGFYVGADQLDALVAIKSKNEVIAEIVALLQSPAKNVISALQSGGNTIHGVLKTLGERTEA